MPSADHYFTESPSSASAPRSVPLVLPDLRMTLRTDRGVFAAERVDAGTKYLLLDAPMPEPGSTVVDIGCGYGPIALTIAQRVEGATVWAVDVNARARELCRANAADLGVELRVIAPEEAPTGLRVDAAYTNPPLRIGRDALRAMFETWLTRLTPGGALIAVVHKHLGSDSLHRWLDQSGWPTERIGSRAGYRLLRVIAPPDQPCAQEAP